MTIKPLLWDCLVSLLCLAALSAAIIGTLDMACGDEVAAARLRLQQIEAEKQQAAEVESAKAKLAPVAEPRPAPETLTPEPDPISTQEEPTISFEHANAATATQERLPRGVLLVSQFCEPCLRIEKECADLCGGTSSPIQIVRNWLANDLERWGITPGMLTSTPVLFILNAEGKVHGLSQNGLSCCLRGYQTRETIEKYLQQIDHGVSLASNDATPVIATVRHAAASPETFAAVLSAHLAESSGQQQEIKYGGLFDFTVDVPDAWKQLGIKLLKSQTIEFPAAGVAVDWTGPQRSFVVSADSVTITPPVKVTLKKWFLSYSAAVDGVQFSPNLSAVKLLLTGAPDLTIHLQ